MLGLPRCEPAGPTRCACARQGCCVMLPQHHPCPDPEGPGLRDITIVWHRFKVIGAQPRGQNQLKGNDGCMQGAARLVRDQAWAHSRCWTAQSMIGEAKLTDSGGGKLRRHTPTDEVQDTHLRCCACPLRRSTRLGCAVSRQSRCQWPATPTAPSSSNTYHTVQAQPNELAALNKTQAIYAGRP
jgi:hypothetical protein